MQRRPEFSFPGSPARVLDRAQPSRPPEEEEVRWLQASLQASPDYYHHSSSGTPSPQLWRAHHDSNHHHQRPYFPASAGSSPSRAEVIAGYRREMLDLVRGLPESAYELSLRDIASIPTPPPPPPAPPAQPTSNTADVARDGHDDTGDVVEEQGTRQSKTTKQGRKQQRAEAVRRQRSRSMERSVSLDTGLLISFFLPLSIRRRKGGGKKKVSPKPDAAGKKENKKQGTKKKQEVKQKQDEERWTKSEFTEASGSSSRTSSTGSSNSNSSTGSVGSGLGGSNPRAPVSSRSWSRYLLCFMFLLKNIITFLVHYWSKTNASNVLQLRRKVKATTRGFVHRSLVYL
ncbi:hypothetical protein PR202_ga24662 [Eleusine coracana subsp. coracana]|uniref:Uncharacterized protein n=1 Tax=Eleusine coracana subsp. coracana TaxID=191504 RepID=A0AAV5D9C1_ELECO|nr:hypothetical protein PR202_ga24662 [Eleusine coracana subsp. coracana]